MDKKIHRHLKVWLQLVNNMKDFLLACVVFVFFKQIEGLSDAEQAIMMKIHEKCLPLSGATDEMAQRAMTGDFSEDPKFKEHLLCIAKGMGFFTETGTINMANIEGQLNQKVSDPAIREEIKNKCVVEKETPQESAFYSAKCMFMYKDRIN